MNKTVDPIFIGYVQNSSANRFFTVNSEVIDITNNAITDSRDATYFEVVFPFKIRISREP